MEHDLSLDRVFWNLMSQKMVGARPRPRAPPSSSHPTHSFPSRKRGESSPLAGVARGERQRFLCPGIAVDADSVHLVRDRAPQDMPLAPWHRVTTRV